MFKELTTILYNLPENRTRGKNTSPLIYEARITLRENQQIQYKTKKLEINRPL